MHQLKLTNYNSKLRINKIYLNLFSKYLLNKCIGEAKFNGRKILPSTKIAKRIEIFNNLNFINLQNA